MLQKFKECEVSRMRFLKKLREDKGLSLYAMAKHLGMIQQTYIHYETKAQGIKLDTLVAIREKLELTWEQLGKLIEQDVRDARKKATSKDK